LRKGSDGRDWEDWAGQGGLVRTEHLTGLRKGSDRRMGRTGRALGGLVRTKPSALTQMKEENVEERHDT
jgi:hypothetical protein